MRQESSYQNLDGEEVRSGWLPSNRSAEEHIQPLDLSSRSFLPPTSCRAATGEGTGFCINRSQPPETQNRWRRVEN